MQMFFFGLSELIYSSLNCYYFQHWFGLLAVWLLVWFSPTSYSWVWWCMNFRICYSSIFLSLYDENDWKRAKEAQIIFLCLLFDYSWVWWFGSTQAPLRPAHHLTSPVRVLPSHLHHHQVLCRHTRSLFFSQSCPCDTFFIKRKQSLTGYNQSK